MYTLFFSLRDRWLMVSIYICGKVILIMSFLVCAILDDGDARQGLPRAFFPDKPSFEKCKYLDRVWFRDHLTSLLLHFLANLQNTGPLLIIHQTSRLVWLVCSFAIHCRVKRAKRATKYIYLGLSEYIDYSAFFYALSSQTSH